MQTKAYQNYLEEEVLAASPLKLIQLLYRGAVDSIGTARRCLQLGDIRARSAAISKAMAIVTELSLALDHGQGGELSRNLAELYGYVQALLIRANAEQIDKPLAEAERLLSTLSEAWNSCERSQEGGIKMESQSEPSASYQRVSCAY